MKRKSKKQKGSFHTNMEIMTNKRIGQMRDIDEQNNILLLQDPSTGFYVVFVKKHLCSFYAKSYQKAQRHFNFLVAQS